MKILFIILAIIGIFIAGGVLYRIVYAAKESQSEDMDKKQ